VGGLRILAVGAHTDDIELGCGGALARAIREHPDSVVRVVSFSRAEASLPPGAPPDMLETEFRRAMGHLGLDDQLEVGRLPVRYFPDHRQDVLERLVAIRTEFQPDLVMTHSSSDTHQDHAVVGAETVRAFRGATVIGYEAPWNQTATTTNFFVPLEPEDVDLKCTMVAEYESQVALHRGYMTTEYVRGAAAMRGRQARTRFAEAFEYVYGVWPW
jgi:LmbE family N-acetylglucosaminyl deacetylase